MNVYRFRMTKAVTADYGDGPAAGQHAIGHLGRIPDGSRWDEFPQTLTISVPLGTRPGGTFVVAIQPESSPATFASETNKDESNAEQVPA